MTAPHYTLTATQFDGLAAGYGAVEAVTILRDGQLAKRKLLLQALMREVEHNPAVDLLLRAEEASPESTTELLRHPHLDGWATQALLGPAAADHLSRVAAAAAVRAGLTFEIDVPVTHGQVYLPTLGAAAADADRTRVIGSGHRKTMIGPVRLGGAGWSAVRAVALEPGFTLGIEDQEPYRDTYHWRPAPRLDAHTAERFRGLLTEAWRIMVARHPDHADAMRVLLRTVVPLATPRSGTSVSAASRHASGSVAVVIPPTAEELCLLLLHEFMHMKLDALRDLVDLHVPEPKGRYLAPWRMDPRPVGALMQGVFAHAGVTDYWRRRRQESDAPPVADVEFAYWRQQNWLAIESLAASDELTVEGRRFVRGLSGTLASWQHDEVPKKVAERVDAMVCAQTVRWRLRNWRPADVELDVMLKAWSSGRRPDAVNPAGVLRTDAEGEASGIPGIVGVIRNDLIGGATGNAADRAYLDGDRALAAALYGARIHQEDSDDAWVGLALATGDELDLLILRCRPDLVRALVRTLTARKEKVDAIAVTGWLRTATSLGSHSPERAESGSSSMLN